MTDGARSATRPGRTPREAATRCPYCARQCGNVLREEADRVAVLPRRLPTNGGGLCRKSGTTPDAWRHLDLPGAAALRHEVRCRGDRVEVRLRQEG
ncbi:hypothetical protein ACIBTV_02850 [Micromonospora sp. NPDC049366]|uniref:hypothetical protein n=1 Tax=Micromonospora sp. NPDC049366 TaxID=3364271 RepID=UPI0037A0A331